MNSKKQKKITVILISFLFILLTIAYMGVFFWGIFVVENTPLLVKILLGAGMVSLCIVMYSLFGNMRMRNREIEEETDLSRY